MDRLNCGAVLALDARWGEGKTWFVRHWQKHLENEGHNVIYLDAFANDYLEDPFLTIAAEISQAFKRSNEIDVEEIEDFNSKTASVLISLASIIPILVAKAGLHWVGLGGAGESFREVYENGKEVYDVASDEIAGKIKEQIEKKIESHHVEKETIQDFKKELAQLAEKLDKPLVFIIDELDRCRPDFAIRLIERIKHFFDIPKIVFVLVMDKIQFSKVVCHNYGYDEKLGEEYLEKFIDFSMKFNPPKSSNQLQLVQGKLVELGIQVELPKFLKIDRLFAFMAEHCQTSTRELIRLIHTFNLLALDNQRKNHILVVYLFLRKNLLIQNSAVDVYQFLTQWFKSIVDLDVELMQQLLYRQQEMNNRGRLFSTHQLYGEVLNLFKEIFIARFFMTNFDEVDKEPSNEYSLHEISKLPFNTYENADNLDFKKEWEFYTFSGLST